MMQDWYAYPQYYEAAFADDTPVEADFIEAACKKYAVGPVRRVFEPGCGGGRLVLEMARRGYRAIGLDNHPQMLAYLRRRIARRKLPAQAVAGDMTEFCLPRPVDAAFCTFNTFRHLPTEQAALAHLKCVAAALRQGGIYVLGFHLLPPDASEECIERWTARCGPTKISFTLRVLECCRAQRYERLRVTLWARSAAREVRAATEFRFRIYTARDVRRLFAKVPELEHVATFDFGYEIDRPTMLDDDLADAVFILRKR